MEVATRRNPGTPPRLVTDAKESGLRSKGKFSLSSLLAEAIRFSPDKETAKTDEKLLLKGGGLSAAVLPGITASQDDFWEALRAHYNYLMDDELISTCREASEEIAWEGEGGVAANHTWSFTEFIQLFNELHDSLHNLQAPENYNKPVSGPLFEELQRAVCGCTVFKEQAAKLCRRYPDMKDEISRRVNLLNNKWEAVELAICPNKEPPSEDVVFQDVAQEMKYLRKWLREIEGGLHSLFVCPSWTLLDLEQKHAEQQVVQKEIESRGQLVSSLLKLCDRLSSNSEEGGPVLAWDATRVRRVAANLEKRWHTVWLRSLEWIYLLEELIRQYKTGSYPADSSLEASFGEEPLNKYPRLSGHWDGIMSDDPIEIEGPVIGPNTTDKAVMVGTTGITQLKAQYGNSNFGRFEIVQDVGYSSESSAHLSNDERQDFVRVYSYTEDQPTVTEYKLNLDQSVGSHKNQDSQQWNEERKMQSVSEFLEEMEEEMMDKTLMPETSDFHLLAAQAEMMVFEESRKTSTPRRIKVGKKSARVKEWLKECTANDVAVSTPMEPEPSDVVVDSSCDASGEYTTNDSDCDSSNADVTFPLSRSGTGSIETVVPLLDVEDQMPRVLLRTKKRRNRDRPWSVTELCQMSGKLNLSPFSTSEGALNTLLSSTPQKPSAEATRKLNPRPVSLRKARRQRSRSSLHSGVLESGSEGTILGCRRSASFVSSHSDNLCSVRGKLTSSRLTEDEKVGEVSYPMVPMHVEDQSSVSDQVWDGYQDPLYFSEPYSEMTADEDQVKKLMDFGDDYHAFISSHSDTSSSCSGRRKSMHKVRPPFQESLGTQSDSDSEREDLHDFITQSCRAFQKTMASFKFSNGDSSEELLATCQTNLKCLGVIAEHLDSSGQGLRNLPVCDLEQLQELISGWQMLRNEILGRQKEIHRDDRTIADVEKPTGGSESRQEVQKDLTDLRKRLIDLSQVPAGARAPVYDPNKLEERIALLQAVLSALHDTKGAMLAINIRVHRLMNQEGLTRSSGLRDEVTELYRQWDDAYEQSGTGLTELRTLQTRWKQFGEKHRELHQMLDLDQRPVGAEEVREHMVILQREAQFLHKYVEKATWDKIATDLDLLTAQMESPVTQPTAAPAPDRADAAIKKRRSRLWRIVRASLPIHLALMLLYCLAWLMEPHCCDFLNTMNFSFSPTLRYTRGPPPV